MTKSAWIGDTRSLLESQIGWIFWNCDRGFGVMHQDNGTSIPDEKLVQVLLESATLSVT